MPMELPSSSSTCFCADLLSVSTASQKELMMATCVFFYVFRLTFALCVANLSHIVFIQNSGIWFWMANSGKDGPTIEEDQVLVSFASNVK
jgi:hypothetical protein